MRLIGLLLAAFWLMLPLAACLAQESVSIGELTEKAEGGDAVSQYELGALYRQGIAVKQNNGEAIKWFRLAAAQGYAPAQYNLGLMYHHGFGVPRNDAEALRWYRSAALQGDVKAQCNLGLIYHDGGGVERNFAEAAKWYGKAAAQGDANAEYNLGTLYQHGEGVKRDAVEAGKWFAKAAAQGDPDAKKMLETLNLTMNQSLPTARENAKAELKSLQQAAEQGDANAQFKLATIYSSGDIEDYDSVEAYKWLSILAGKGDAKARAMLDELQRNMAPPQIAEAQRRAAAWHAKVNNGHP